MFGLAAVVATLQQLVQVTLQVLVVVTYFHVVVVVVVVEIGVGGICYDVGCSYHDVFIRATSLSPINC